ncbi:hypothetical protein OG389_07785 [Streptomyces sp. NBC_00435]|uniref:hypothetical protein n=1 Tax=Streptomyces sp. NBC_00435 TaxID=2903649 RepID=UPI002E1F8892
MADIQAAAERGAARIRVRTRLARAAHPWQVTIALLALILPAPTVVQMLTVGLSVPVLIVPVLLLALPPALRAVRGRFMTACVVLAVVLFLWSYYGFAQGAWIFLPSVPMLLCANFADPRGCRAAATVATGLAVIVAIVPALFSCGVLMEAISG